MTDTPGGKNLIDSGDDVSGLPIQSILARFLEADSEQAVFDTVTRTVHEAIGGDRAMVIRVEGDETTVASRHPSVRAGEPGVPPGVRELVVESFESNRSEVIDDRMAVRGSTATSPLPAPTRDRSLLIVPFANLGGVTVSADAPHAFDDAELAWADQLVSCGERALEHLPATDTVLVQVGEILAHDVMAPLQVAKGRLDMAKSTGDPKHFEKIEAAHVRLEDLIDGAVTLIRTGNQMTETEPVDLAEEAETVWSLIDPSNADLQIEASAIVEADGNCLRQILENLFRNAIDHAKNGVTVTLGLLEKGFYVADNGPGIPPGRRKAVFEPGVSTSQTNSGLGLSIVHRLVEAHGWTIRLLESDDGGTRVELENVDFR